MFLEGFVFQDVLVSQFSDIFHGSSSIEVPVAPGSCAPKHLVIERAAAGHATRSGRNGNKGTATCHQPELLSGWFQAIEVVRAGDMYVLQKRRRDRELLVKIIRALEPAYLEDASALRT
jgi:hypothetical protein